MGHPPSHLPAVPNLSRAEAFDPGFSLHAAHPISHTQRRGMAEPVEVENHVSWKTLLTYITGTVDQELLVRNEYLVTENRILCNYMHDNLW